MFLRQNTIRVIRFGPFVDATDGVTPETALTITQGDMRLSKEGGNFAQKNAAGNATHDENGWYFTTLNATDTNTVGELIFSVSQPANTAPVWHNWQVVEESVFDRLYASGAAGYSTFDPTSDTVTASEVILLGSNSITAASFAPGAIDAAAIATDAIGAAEFSQAAADKVWASTTRTLTGVVSANVTSWQGIPQVAVNGLANVNVGSWQGVTIPGANMIEDDAGDGRWTAQALEQAPAGGGGLTEQQVRDAMKLAPTAGAPAAGSVDLHLDDIQGKTDGLNFTGNFVQSDVQSYDGNAAAVKVGATSALPQVDAEAISDSPTAALNLSDFALQGYDTTTNQVNGVKLVDTTTTNTDMRGTDGASTLVATDIVSDGIAITTTLGVVNNVASVVNVVEADVTTWQGFTIPGASMIENDGAGAGRYTTKALEQAPSAGGGTDWTVAEREQIRDSLGVDGTKTAATGGQLQNKLEPTTPGRTLTVATNNSAKIDFDLAAGTISSGQIDNGALNGKGDWSTLDPLTTQETADAMRVTPTGTVNVGSVDEKLTNITTTGGPGPWTTGTAANANSDITLLSPTAFQTPESGTTSFTVYVFAQDENGLPVNTDSTPTITAEDFQGTSLDGNWAGAATNPATGEYRRVYNVPSTHPLGEILFRATAEIAGNSRRSGDITTIVEEESGLQPGDLAQIRYRLQIDGTQTAPAADAPTQLPIDVQAWDGNASAVKIGPNSGLPEVEMPLVEQQAIATQVLTLPDGVETNRTLQESQRIILSAAAGVLSGAATTNVLIRDSNNTKTRINATVDASGNRTAVTLDDT